MNMAWVTCVVIALGISVGVMADSDQASLCLSTCEDTADGFYSDCADCNGFLVCSEGMSLRVHCPVGTAWNDVTKSCDETALESCRHGNENVAQFSMNSTETPRQDNSRLESHVFQIFQSDLRKLFTKWVHEIDSTYHSKPEVKAAISYNPENELRRLSQEHWESQSQGDARLVPQPDVPHLKQKTPISETVVRSEVPVDGNSTLVFSKESWDSNDGGAVTDGGNSSTAAENLTLTGDESAVETPESAIKMTEKIRQHLKAVIHNSASPHKRQPKTTGTSSPNAVSGDCFFRSGGVTTFDNQKLVVSGNCRYVATRVCGSSDLFVEVKMSMEEGKQNRTLVDYVDVVIGSRWARLHSVGVAFADGIVIPPGRSETNNKFSVKTEAEFSQLETDDGIVATVDREHRFFLFLPEIYSGKMCGLCGNMNGDSSDDVIVQSAVFEYNVRSLPEQSDSCAAQFTPKKE